MAEPGPIRGGTADSGPRRTTDPDERRAFRAFVRAHHPDRGGDPGVFRAGIDAFRARQATRGGAQPDVTFFRRGGLVGLLRRAARAYRRRRLRQQ
ncbi:hypothetical protein [Pengzhenrongella sp.]|uniref:hypothetical protein n=1 Tax=Pengzhenrongella sp. TaxID=2888820 RepID=UPI002F91FBE1